MHILHILYITSKYDEQNRALLESAGHSAYSSPRPPDRAYTTRWANACLVVSICAEEIAADQSPGHGVYPPAWDI